MMNIVRKTHCLEKYLRIDNQEYRQHVLDFFENNLRLDVSDKGDITSHLLPDPKRKTEAFFLAKSDGVVAGIEEIEFFLNHVEKLSSIKLGEVSVNFKVRDSESLIKGREFGSLKGSAQDILLLERTILNFLQRMSGVATATAKARNLSAGKVLITPTRKTLWPLFDKKACMVGGGGTHRLSLSDAVLVKDNHVALFGNNFALILDKIFGSSKEQLGNFVEIEVTSKNDALKVAQYYCEHSPEDFQPLYIMLDNMKVTEIKMIINRCKKMGWQKNIFFEASGGINFKNLKAYSLSGVDIISLGMLTHSAKALDISLEFRT